MKKVGGEVFSSSYYYILAGTTLLFFHDPRVAVTEAWIPPLLSSQSSLSCSTLGIHQAVARSHPTTVSSSCHSWTIRLQATSDGDGDADDDDTRSQINPYQDPNYPDLEFVDYSDPDYRVDQGVGDELFDPTISTTTANTEEQIEELREERRIRNDEFQFETYYKEVLKEGKEYKGEWTVYTTSTFSNPTKEEIDMDDGIPKVRQSSKITKVISRGERIQLEQASSSSSSEQQSPSTYRLQHDRLLHHEKVYTDSEDEEKTSEQLTQEEQMMSRKYWPDQLASTDFRGAQGIMCVGNAYTVCTGIKLHEADPNSPVHEGPFGEYRSELGIQFEDLRFRVKVDYAVTNADKEAMSLPPLRLRSFIVCRETLEMWPRAKNYKSAIQALTDAVFFGPAGADNGLYDPPRIETEEQAGQYLLLDLEGGATLLLPYLMDQDPTVYAEAGWVTSLDWSPGQYRFQVDRKVNGGKDILGLKTLELSQVESADADTYRPRDGGADMRQ